jgi:hypothetical protein
MKRTMTAIALATALGLPTLGLPTLAQEGQTLSGTVAEVFGRQAVVATATGRVLVQLPDGVEVPAQGARVDLAGTLAGETFAATAVTVTGVVDPAEEALPAALRGLGLTQVRTRPDDDGETYIHAAMPGGGWLRAEARGDRLLEVQSDGAGLPEPLIAALLPETVRAEPRLADIERITEIDLDNDGEIDVEGFAADGMRIEMEFDRAGRLTDLDLERDDRRSLTEDAARQRLAELGYGEVGFVNRGGRHVDAVALNPYGDWVEVRLDERGRVERERLWDR